MEPDDVVIADTGGQALDIVLHGPESAHKNDIVKTFTHTSIPIHPCTLLKQTNSKTINSPNMTPSFSPYLPVQCAGGRRPANLAPAPHDCYTSESFSPRTVLTVFFCRCVQRHRPATIPLITNNYNNLFLPEFSSSPGWHPVSRTRGAWWCRYRGHWWSGRRHRSLRSRGCAQEWHRKDKHSLTHSFPSTHTHSENKQ